MEIVEAMPPRIQVHDASFNMVHKGFGSLEEKLDPGLYLVRVENGPRPFEEVIHVPSGGRAGVSYPVFSQPLSSSAGVVNGSSSFHEYTGNYTRALSETEAKVKLGAGARLVVLASRAEGRARSARTMEVTVGLAFVESSVVFIRREGKFAGRP
jgi:hypothetical protein